MSMLNVEFSICKNLKHYWHTLLPHYINQTVQPFSLQPIWGMQNVIHVILHLPKQLGLEPWSLLDELDSKLFLLFIIVDA